MGKRRIQAAELLSRARVRLSQRISRLVLGPCVGRVLENVVGSVAESGESERVCPHLVRAHALKPCEVLSVSYPKHFPPWFRRTIPFETQYVYEMENVIVSPESGLVWTPSGTILLESAGSLHRLLSWGDVLHKPLVSARLLDYEGTVIAFPELERGYYHWLLEFVPNVLEALCLYPGAKLLMSEKGSRSLSSVIRMLGGEGFLQGQTLLRQGPQLCSRLVFCAVSSQTGVVRPSTIQRIRDTYQPGLRMTPGKPRRRILVSRRMSWARTVDNEEELRDVLTRLSFDAVSLERMDFEAQIRLMSEAQCIVGMHGAGLANMVWARPPCRVIEVFPMGCYADCYGSLASVSGFQHDFVRCVPGRTKWGRIPVDAVAELVTRPSGQDTAAHPERGRGGESNGAGP